MKGYGAPKRTQADRDLDCVRFCTTARIEMVRAASAEELAGRYGVSVKLAEWQRTIRLQREGAL